MVQATSKALEGDFPFKRTTIVEFDVLLFFHHPPKAEITYCVQFITNSLPIVIGMADSTNQNGNKFPLFDLNSGIIFIRLFVGYYYVLFNGKSHFGGGRASATCEWGEDN